MRLVSNIEERKQNINIGDIIIFSECQAYMIIKSDIEYLAIQIFNNGNEELGYINYTDPRIEKLRERLFRDYGFPINITHMRDVNLSLK